MRLESNHPGGDQQRRAVLDPPLRPALRPSRSAAQDPPYGETTFNPTTPATIRPMHASRAGEALSRSEEHTSELQSLMRISYAVFCLKKKNKITNNNE